jgi:16S rRNA (cytidine1402-2'-O)-methyltransferase
MPDPPQLKGPPSPSHLGTGENSPIAPGLYLVATPIGNLDDITLRALHVLRSVDRIACEDTRQTQKLLNHFQIDVPTISCHEHNELSRAAELVHEIKRGSAIAVVSDAGMPGISDPGSRLVQSAIEAGIAVIPIPGANAALCALVASGLPAAEFAFLGFLPEKAGARRTRLEELAAEALDLYRRPPGRRSRASPHPRITTEDKHSVNRETSEAAGKGALPTLIFYEAPHRILDTLADLESVWGSELRIVVARELTKMHEEFLRGSVAEVRRELGKRDRVRGEITLIVEPPLKTSPGGSAGATEKLTDRLARIQAETGVDEKEALKRLARESGRSKSELYRELQRQRARLK